MRAHSPRRSVRRPQQGSSVRARSVRWDDGASCTASQPALHCSPLEALLDIESEAVAHLRIETRSDGDVARLVLSGEFDLSGITHFQDLLAKVEQGDARTIVVDLSEVEFMDSSGL